MKSTTANYQQKKTATINTNANTTSTYGSHTHTGKKNNFQPQHPVTSKVLERLAFQRNAQITLFRKLCAIKPSLNAELELLFSIACSRGEESLQQMHMSRASFAYFMEQYGVTTMTPYHQFEGRATIHLRDRALKQFEQEAIMAAAEDEDANKNACSGGNDVVGEFNRMTISGAPSTVASPRVFSTDASPVPSARKNNVNEKKGAETNPITSERPLNSEDITFRSKYGNTNGSTQQQQNQQTQSHNNNASPRRIESSAFSASHYNENVFTIKLVRIAIDSVDALFDYGLGFPTVNPAVAAAASSSALTKSAAKKNSIKNSHRQSVINGGEGSNTHRHNSTVNAEDKNAQNKTIDDNNESVNNNENNKNLLSVGQFTMLCVAIAQRLVPEEDYPPLSSIGVHLDLLQQIFLGPFAADFKKGTVPGKYLNEFTIPPSVKELLQGPVLDTLAHAYASVTNAAMIVPNKGSNKRGEVEDENENQVDDLMRADFFVQMFTGDIPLEYEALIALLQHVGISTAKIGGDFLYKLFQRYDTRLYETRTTIDFHSFILLLLHVSVIYYNSGNNNVPPFSLMGQESDATPKTQRPTDEPVEITFSNYKAVAANQQTFGVTGSLAAAKGSELATIASRFQRLIRDHFLKQFPVDDRLYFISKAENLPRAVRPMSELHKLNVRGTPAPVLDGVRPAVATLGSQLWVFGNHFPVKNVGGTSAYTADSSPSSSASFGKKCPLYVRFGRADGSAAHEDAIVASSGSKDNANERILDGGLVFARGACSSATMGSVSMPHIYPTGDTRTDLLIVQTDRKLNEIDGDNNADEYEDENSKYNLMLNKKDATAVAITGGRKNDDYVKFEEKYNYAVVLETTTAVPVFVSVDRLTWTLRDDIVIEYKDTLLKIRLTKDLVMKFRLIFSAFGLRGPDYEDEEGELRIGKQYVGLQQWTDICRRFHIAGVVEEEDDEANDGETGANDGIVRNPDLDFVFQRHQIFFEVAKPRADYIDLNAPVVDFNEFIKLVFLYFSAHHGVTTKLADLIAISFENAAAVTTEYRKDFYKRKFAFWTPSKDREAGRKVINSEVIIENSRSNAYITNIQTASVAQVAEVVLSEQQHHSSKRRDSRSGALIPSSCANCGCDPLYKDANNPILELEWKGSNAAENENANAPSPKGGQHIVESIAAFAPPLPASFRQQHQQQPLSKRKSSMRKIRSQSQLKNNNNNNSSKGSETAALSPRFVKKDGANTNNSGDTANAIPMESIVEGAGILTTSFAISPQNSHLPAATDGKLKATLIVDSEYDDTTTTAVNNVESDTEELLSTTTITTPRGQQQQHEGTTPLLVASSSSQASMRGFAGQHLTEEREQTVIDAKKLQEGMSPRVREAMANAKSTLETKRRLEPVAAAKTEPTANDDNNGGGINSAAFAPASSVTESHHQHHSHRRADTAEVESFMKVANKDKAIIEDSFLQSYIFKALAAVMETMPPDDRSDDIDADTYAGMSFDAAMALSSRGRMCFISALLDRFLTMHNDVVSEGEAYFQRSIAKAKAAGRAMSLQLFTLQRSMEAIAVSLEKLETIVGDAHQTATSERKSRLAGEIKNSETLWAMENHYFDGMKRSLTFIGDLTRPFINEEAAVELHNAGQALSLADNFLKEVKENCQALDNALKSRVSEAKDGPMADAIISSRAGTDLTYSMGIAKGTLDPNQFTFEDGGGRGSAAGGAGVTSPLHNASHNHISGMNPLGASPMLGGRLVPVGERRTFSSSSQQQQLMSGGSLRNGSLSMGASSRRVGGGGGGLDFAEVVKRMAQQNGLLKGTGSGGIGTGMDPRSLENQKRELAEEFDRQIEEVKITLQNSFEEDKSKYETKAFQKQRELSYLLQQLMKFKQNALTIPKDLATPILKALAENGMALKSGPANNNSNNKKGDLTSPLSTNNSARGAAGGDFFDDDDDDTANGGNANQQQQMSGPPADAGTQVNEDELPSLIEMQNWLQMRGVKNASKLSLCGALLRNAFLVGKRALTKHATNPVLFEEFSKMLKFEMQFTFNPRHLERVSVPKALADLNSCDATTSTLLTLKGFEESEKYAGFELKLDALEKLCIVTEEQLAAKEAEEKKEKKAAATGAGGGAKDKKKDTAANKKDAASAAPSSPAQKLVAAAVAVSAFKLPPPASPLSPLSSPASPTMKGGKKAPELSPKEKRQLEAKQTAQSLLVGHTFKQPSLPTSADSPLNEDIYFATLQQRMLRRAARLDSDLISKLYSFDDRCQLIQTEKSIVGPTKELITQTDISGEIQSEAERAQRRKDTETQTAFDEEEDDYRKAFKSIDDDDGKYGDNTFLTTENDEGGEDDGGYDYDHKKLPTSKHTRMPGFEASALLSGSNSQRRGNNNNNANASTSSQVSPSPSMMMGRTASERRRKTTTAISPEAAKRFSTLSQGHSPNRSSVVRGSIGNDGGRRKSQYSRGGDEDDDYESEKDSLFSTTDELDDNDLRLLSDAERRAIEERRKWKEAQRKERRLKRVKHAARKAMKSQEERRLKKIREQEEKDEARRRRMAGSMSVGNGGGEDGYNTLSPLISHHSSPRTARNNKNQNAVTAATGGGSGSRLPRSKSSRRKEKKKKRRHGKKKHKSADSSSSDDEEDFNADDEDEIISDDDEDRDLALAEEALRLEEEEEEARRKSEAINDVDGENAEAENDDLKTTSAKKPLLTAEEREVRKKEKLNQIRLERQKRRDERVIRRKQKLAELKQRRREARENCKRAEKEARRQQRKRDAGGGSSLSSDYDSDDDSSFDDSSSSDMSSSSSSSSLYSLLDDHDDAELRDRLSVAHVTTGIFDESSDIHKNAKETMKRIDEREEKRRQREKEKRRRRKEKEEEEEESRRRRRRREKAEREKKKRRQRNGGDLSDSRQNCSDFDVSMGHTSDDSLSQLRSSSYYTATTTTDSTSSSSSSSSSSFMSASTNSNDDLTTKMNNADDNQGGSFYHEVQTQRVNAETGKVETCTVVRKLRREDLLAAKNNTTAEKKAKKRAEKKVPTRVVPVEVEEEVESEESFYEEEEEQRPANGYSDANVNATTSPIRKVRKVTKKKTVTKLIEKPIISNDNDGNDDGLVDSESEAHDSDEDATASPEPQQRRPDRKMKKVVKFVKLLKNPTTMISPPSATLATQSILKKTTGENAFSGKGGDDGDDNTSPVIANGDGADGGGPPPNVEYELVEVEVEVTDSEDEDNKRDAEEANRLKLERRRKRREEHEAKKREARRLAKAEEARRKEVARRKRRRDNEKKRRRENDDEDLLSISSESLSSSSTTASSELDEDDRGERRKRKEAKRRQQRRDDEKKRERKRRREKQRRKDEKQRKRAEPSLKSAESLLDATKNSNSNNSTSIKNVQSDGESSSRSSSTSSFSSSEETHKNSSFVADRRENHLRLRDAKKEKGNQKRRHHHHHRDEQQRSDSGGGSINRLKKPTGSYYNDGSNTSPSAAGATTLNINIKDGTREMKLYHFFNEVVVDQDDTVADVCVTTSVNTDGGGGQDAMSNLRKSALNHQNVRTILVPIRTQAIVRRFTLASTAVNTLNNGSKAKLTTSNNDSLSSAPPHASFSSSSSPTLLVNDGKVPHFTAVKDKPVTYISSALPPAVRRFLLDGKEAGGGGGGVGGGKDNTSPSAAASASSQKEKVIAGSGVSVDIYALHQKLSEKLKALDEVYKKALTMLNMKDGGGSDGDNSNLYARGTSIPILSSTKGKLGRAADAEEEFFGKSKSNQNALKKAIMQAREKAARLMFMRGDSLNGSFGDEDDDDDADVDSDGKRKNRSSKKSSTADEVSHRIAKAPESSSVAMYRGFNKQQGGGDGGGATTIEVRSFGRSLSEIARMKAREKSLAEKRQRRMRDNNGDEIQEGNASEGGVTFVRSGGNREERGNADDEDGEEGEEGKAIRRHSSLLSESSSDASSFHLKKAASSNTMARYMKRLRALQRKTVASLTTDDLKEIIALKERTEAEEDANTDNENDAQKKNIDNNKTARQPPPMTILSSSTSPFGSPRSEDITLEDPLGEGKHHHHHGIVHHHSTTKAQHVFDSRSQIAISKSEYQALKRSTIASTVVLAERDLVRNHLEAVIKRFGTSEMYKRFVNFQLEQQQQQAAGGDGDDENDNSDSNCSAGLYEVMELLENELRRLHFAKAVEGQRLLAAAAANNNNGGVIRSPAAGGGDVGHGQHVIGSDEANKSASASPTSSPLLPRGIKTIDQLVQLVEDCEMLKIRYFSDRIAPPTSSESSTTESLTTVRHQHHHRDEEKASFSPHPSPPSPPQRLLLLQKYANSSRALAMEFIKDALFIKRNGEEEGEKAEAAVVSDAPPPAAAPLSLAATDTKLVAIIDALINKVTLGRNHHRLDGGHTNDDDDDDQDTADDKKDKKKKNGGFINKMLNDVIRAIVATSFSRPPAPASKGPEGEGEENTSNDHDDVTFLTATTRRRTSPTAPARSVTSMADDARMLADDAALRSLLDGAKEEEEEREDEMTRSGKKEGKRDTQNTVTIVDENDGRQQKGTTAKNERRRRASSSSSNPTHHHQHTQQKRQQQPTALIFQQQRQYQLEEVNHLINSTFALLDERLGDPPLSITGGGGGGSGGEKSTAYAYQQRQILLNNWRQHIVNTLLDKVKAQRKGVTTATPTTATSQTKQKQRSKDKDKGVNDDVDAEYEDMLTVTAEERWAGVHAEQRAFIDTLCARPRLTRERQRLISFFHLRAAGYILHQLSSSSSSSMKNGDGGGGNGGFINIARSLLIDKLEEERTRKAANEQEDDEDDENKGTMGESKRDKTRKNTLASILRSETTSMQFVLRGLFNETLSEWMINHLIPSSSSSSSRRHRRRTKDELDFSTKEATPIPFVDDPRTSVLMSSKQQNETVENTSVDLLSSSSSPAHKIPSDWCWRLYTFDVDEYIRLDAAYRRNREERGGENSLSSSSPSFMRYQQLRDTYLKASAEQSGLIRPVVAVGGAGDGDGESKTHGEAAAEEAAAIPLLSPLQWLTKATNAVRLWVRKCEEKGMRVVPFTTASQTPSTITTTTTAQSLVADARDITTPMRHSGAGGGVRLSSSRPQRTPSATRTRIRLQNVRVDNDDGDDEKQKNMTNHDAADRVVPNTVSAVTTATISAPLGAGNLLGRCPVSWLSPSFSLSPSSHNNNNNSYKAASTSNTMLMTSRHHLLPPLPSSSSSSLSGGTQGRKGGEQQSKNVGLVSSSPSSLSAVGGFSMAAAGAVSGVASSAAAASPNQQRFYSHHLSPLSKSTGSIPNNVNLSSTMADTASASSSLSQTTAFSAALQQQRRLVQLTPPPPKAQSVTATTATSAISPPSMPAAGGGGGGVENISSISNNNSNSYSDKAALKALNKLFPSITSAASSQQDDTLTLTSSLPSSEVSPSSSSSSSFPLTSDEVHELSLLRNKALLSPWAATNMGPAMMRRWAILELRDASATHRASFNSPSGAQRERPVPFAEKVGALLQRVLAMENDNETEDIHPSTKREENNGGVGTNSTGSRGNSGAAAAAISNQNESKNTLVIPKSDANKDTSTSTSSSAIMNNPSHIVATIMSLSRQQILAFVNLLGDTKVRLAPPPPSKPIGGVSSHTSIKYK